MSIQVLLCMPVLKKLKLEGLEFETSLDFTIRIPSFVIVLLKKEINEYLNSLMWEQQTYAVV